MGQMRKPNQAVQQYTIPLFVERERDACVIAYECMQMQSGRHVQEKDLVGSDLQASPMTACPSKQVREAELAGLTLAYWLACC